MPAPASGPRPRSGSASTAVACTWWDPRAAALSHPAWFHNLRANPSVTVELGGESYQARAVVTQGAERDRLYGLIAAQVPAFGEYEKSTDRTFPVVVLEGVPAPA